LDLSGDDLAKAQRSGNRLDHVAVPRPQQGDKIATAQGDWPRLARAIEAEKTLLYRSYAKTRNLS
jgi:hypothetical protein